jgi:hypothetical protein
MGFADLLVALRFEGRLPGETQAVTHGTATTIERVTRLRKQSKINADVTPAPARTCVPWSVWPLAPRRSG